VIAMVTKNKRRMIYCCSCLKTGNIRRGTFYCLAYDIYTYLVE